MKLVKQATRVAQARLGRPQLVYAHYGVTHRCNMRCRMCVVWHQGNKDTEMTTSQAAHLAENLQKAGILTVALGGGEPFVRKDLPEIVHSFAKRGIEVRVLTNGIGIKESRIKEVIDAGLSHVSVSLDSLDPAVEQRVYNNVDVWQDIVATMRRFRAWLPKSSVPVMNVCVARNNLLELPNLVDFAAHEGFHCSFVPIAISPSEAESDGFAAVAPELAVPAEMANQVRAIYHELLERKRSGHPIANSSRFLKDSRDFLINQSSSWTCDAGRLYISVSPEGDISICHGFAPIARFDTPNLQQLLRSKEVATTARRQRKDCEGCMRPCWAEVTHATHNMRAALEAVVTLHGLDALRRIS
jgi:radical SAM protein with 4Fe4S-binding SPASM domain